MKYSKGFNNEKRQFFSRSSIWLGIGFFAVCLIIWAIIEIFNIPY